MIEESEVGPEQKQRAFLDQTIARVCEESVLSGVAFTSNFSPSLAFCAGTKPLASEEKIWAGSLRHPILQSLSV